MARLSSDKYLIQQIGDNVILFEDGSERQIVKYDVDVNATAQAQLTIVDSELNPEDKSFAHFWCGYFYAHACHAED
jgi:spore coat polysaccharide biosynthesis predicted glycosyltransferase SpsG